MPRNKTKIKNKLVKINNALEQGAPTVEFNGYKQSDTQAMLDEINAEEAHNDNLRTQKKLSDDKINKLYDKADNMNVAVGKGVAGHKDYGDDSELYGAMDFVRKSERKSGLTRGKKKDGGSDDEDK